MNIEEKITKLEERIKELEYWKGLHQRFHCKFVPDKLKEAASHNE